MHRMTLRRKRRSPRQSLKSVKPTRTLCVYIIYYGPVLCYMYMYVYMWSCIMLVMYMYMYVYMGSCIMLVMYMYMYYVSDVHVCVYTCSPVLCVYLVCVGEEAGAEGMSSA